MGLNNQFSQDDTITIPPFAYWDGWITLIQQLFQGAAHNHEKNKTDESSWVQALELWWHAAQPQLPPDRKVILRRFIEQGKSYFRLNGEFLRVFQEIEPSERKAEVWQHYCEQGFSELRQNYQTLLDENQSTLGFWTQPLNSWRETVVHLTATPQAAPQQLQEKLDAWLPTPSAGQQREWLARLQKSIALQCEYQQAQQAYSDMMGRIGLQTIDFMRDTILANPQQSLTHLRDIYELWADCGEAVYAERVASPQYAQIYASLINRLMLWKQHEQAMLDDLLSLLNMPTRSELSQLHQRIHQMRRETQAIQGEHLAVCDATRQELEIMRAELDALKSSFNPIADNRA